MDDFLGHEFYDYYESVTLTCRYPGCDWEGATAWEENMHEPFVEHFLATHGRIVATVTLHHDVDGKPGEQHGPAIPVPPERPWRYVYEIPADWPAYAVIHAAMRWQDGSEPTWMLPACVQAGDTYTVEVRWH